jgi:biotin synthase
MTKNEILRWLTEDDNQQLESLWRWADKVREEMVGNEVHLRGLIEFSNHCVRQCGYCGLRADRRDLPRYRMTQEEILACARKAVTFGYGTVVLQSGEDWAMTADWLAEVVRAIKNETSLAITLSLGERKEEEYLLWKKAGVDRYLLRFETSNPRLYAHIHPNRGETVSDRLTILRQLRTLGYEIGSGVMIGIPGQTYDDLASDIALFAELDLDMIGVGPYISHSQTPLADEPPADYQVPNTESMTYRVIALTRLVCPQANIPSTTALATLNLAQGREFGLSRGANVVMPNLTPAKYRADYEIYPAKACIRETAEKCHCCMKRRIESIGRTIGIGPGSRQPLPTKRYSMLSKSESIPHSR